MFDDLPPDLERLQTLRVWHAMWLARIDRKIAAIRKRQAEAEHGRRVRPRPPEWIVELGIGNGGPPVQVHAGDCHIAGRRRRPVSREDARRLLASGLPSCGHRRPDRRLNILDLAARALGRRADSKTTSYRAPRPDATHTVRPSDRTGQPCLMDVTALRRAQRRGPAGSGSGSTAGTTAVRSPVRPTGTRSAADAAPRHSRASRAKPWV